MSDRFYFRACCFCVLSGAFMRVGSAVAVNTVAVLETIDAI